MIRDLRHTDSINIFLGDRISLQCITEYFLQLSLDIFHVKALANQGYGRKEIASKAGLHPFVAGKNMEQAKRFKMGQLRRVMEEGAQLEQDVKTGLLTDNLAVELFIVKQSER